MVSTTQENLQWTPSHLLEDLASLFSTAQTQLPLGPLDSLVTEQMDAEQVWAQIQMREEKIQEVNTIPIEEKWGEMEEMETSDEDDDHMEGEDDIEDDDEEIGDEEDGDEDESDLDNEEEEESDDDALPIEQSSKPNQNKTSNKSTHNKATSAKPSKGKHHIHADSEDDDEESEEDEDEEVDEVEGDEDDDEPIYYKDFFGDGEQEGEKKLKRNSRGGKNDEPLEDDAEDDLGDDLGDDLLDLGEDEEEDDEDEDDEDGLQSENDEDEDEDADLDELPNEVDDPSQAIAKPISEFLKWPEKKEKFKDIQKAKMAQTISALERENLGPKTWTLAGEVQAKDRPKDSLLDEFENIDFERTMKPVPINGEEENQSLEDIIKSRITEGKFDSLAQVTKAKTKEYDPNRKSGFIEDSAPQQSLAQIYENEFTGAHSTAKIQKLNGAHEEITTLMTGLMTRLDSLANAFYVPVVANPEMRVIHALPSIQIEEATPAFISSADQVAPQEVLAPTFDLRARAEMSKEDRTRLRRGIKRRKKRELKREDTSAKGLAKSLASKGVKIIGDHLTKDADKKKNRKKEEGKPVR